MAGDTPCVPWGGTTNRNGYGVLPRAVHGSRLAHRAALAEKLGRPVEGLALHDCDNPPCVNPEHLYEGSQADNVRDAVARGRARGRDSGKTHCTHGHPLTDNNVRVKTYPDGRTERACITCYKNRNREQAQRRKAARAMKENSLG